MNLVQNGNSVGSRQQFGELGILGESEYQSFGESVHQNFF
jgi:hypothetical protein